MTLQEQIETRDNEHVRQVLKLKTRETGQLELCNSSIRGILAQARQMRQSLSHYPNQSSYNTWNIRHIPTGQKQSGEDIANPYSTSTHCK